MKGRWLALLLLLSPGTRAAQAASQNPWNSYGTLARPPADTNDALLQYRFGLELIRQRPAAAETAFIRAAEIDPEQAAYPYARFIARHLQAPYRLVRYLQLDLVPYETTEVRLLDSLMLRAIMLDPFVHRNLDLVMMVRAMSTGVERGASEERIGLLAWSLEGQLDLMAGTDSGLAAQLSYNRGEFGRALEWNARLLSRDSTVAGLHAHRAHMQYLAGTWDSARTHMMSALRLVREQEAARPGFIYESKAVWEHALGRILEQLADLDAAREAYRRALIEDLSYYPAQIQLGVVNARMGDTTAALLELGRAVALREDEYAVRAAYGRVLAAAGKLDSAEVHLARAVELAPIAPGAHLMLASVRDARGNHAGALFSYESFIELAPRNDPDLRSIAMRVLQLRGARR